MHKNVLFLLKDCKNGPALGAPPLDPRQPPSSLRNPSYAIGVCIPVSQIHSILNVSVV